MQKRDTENDLLIKELYRKLFFLEIQHDLLSLCTYIMTDDLYTPEDAVNRIIEVVEVLEGEQSGILKDMRRLRNSPMNHYWRDKTSKKDKNTN